MRSLTVAALTAAFFMPAAAPAQTVCGERATFLAKLGQDYKEAPTAMGVTADGRMVEVLTSEAGTWTMIITHPNGRTCIVTAGQGWESFGRISPNKQGT